MILDLFSRFVVGWALSAVNDRHLTIKALEMALKRRCPDFGLLHHSDQDCTYASEDYQDLLDARGIVCSMSRRGNCYDNAVMESFFSTERLGGAPQLGSHRLQHSPLRRVRLAMLLDHPDRSLPHRYCQVPHVWRHHDE